MSEIECLGGINRNHIKKLNLSKTINGFVIGVESLKLLIAEQLPQSRRLNLNPVRDVDESDFDYIGFQPFDLWDDKLRKWNDRKFMNLMTGCGRKEFEMKLEEIPSSMDDLITTFLRTITAETQELILPVTVAIAIIALDAANQPPDATTRYFLNLYLPTPEGFELRLVEVTILVEPVSWWAAFMFGPMKKLCVKVANLETCGEYYENPNM
eukprot:TRINITY_DN10455_c0_g1_i2.p1 TRINITY_DN10455_c0_g1~~TRINITY_DN10455_c0_g1_i2.p1  ORF type:complete len:211 (+),score=18.31 TRINITY_DN10455_c0_g1_i2:3-635(+)